MSTLVARELQGIHHAGMDGIGQRALDGVEVFAEAIYLDLRH
jgi:hypothetical protein